MLKKLICSCLLLAFILTLGLAVTACTDSGETDTTVADTTGADTPTETPVASEPTDTVEAPTEPVDVPEETTAPATTDPTEETTAATVVSRFAVFSDVHIGKTNVTPLPESKWASALDQLSSVLPGCEAVMVVGDMTNEGYDDQYENFVKIWNEHKPADAVLCPVMGNHEYYRNSGALEAYNKYLGELYTDTVVGGIHVISIGMESSGGHYSSCEAYIKEHVKAAAEEDPNKPIILLTHMSVANVYESESGAFPEGVKSFLARYPQVIVFSGHDHYSLYDPRTIQQTSYTTVQTSTLGADLWNHMSLNPKQPTGKDNVSEGLLVSVTDANVVTITRYDFFRQTEICEPWIIDIPAVKDSKDNRIYGNNRKKEAADPVFPEGAKVTVTDVTDAGMKVNFPAATVTDTVSDGQIYMYHIEVRASGASNPTVKYDMLGEYYLGKDAAKNYTVPMEGLLGATTYTVTVKAETAWGKTVTLTSSSFTTLETEDVDDSDAKVLVYADYTSGSYEDKSEFALTSEVFGNARIENGEAILDKESAYAYHLTEEIYSLIPANFSLEFEVYIDPDQTFPWGYVTLVGNTEAGGFGASYMSSGVLKLEINIGGSYQELDAYIPTGEWVHVLLTYDGASMKTYLNGALAASGACSGNIKHVSPVSRKLMVGADVNGSGETQTISNIKMKFVRLYDKGLSAKTAAELAKK